MSVWCRWAINLCFLLDGFFILCFRVQKGWYLLYRLKATAKQKLLSLNLNRHYSAAYHRSYLSIDSNRVIWFWSSKTCRIFFWLILIPKWNLHHSWVVPNTQAVASEDMSKLFFNNCITQQLQACSIPVKTAQCKDSLDRQAKLSCKILRGKRCRVRFLARTGMYSSVVFSIYTAQTAI